MRAEAPPPRPQTIKQAKAAFKTRGRPSLTEREQKQLERSLELDRRAWRTRELEKKRAEAAKTKSEKEKRERQERERAQMDSQRRRDRFGYQCSQLHLGAFLNKKPVEQGEQKASLTNLAEGSELDDFGDDGVDDDALLDALDGQTDSVTGTTKPPKTHTKPHSTLITSVQHETSHTLHRKTEACHSVSAELDSFWNELDSSTQIARDLASDERSEAESQPSPNSFSTTSDDFDLTVEDLEGFHPTTPPQKKHDQDRQLMPPPPIPAKSSRIDHGITLSQLECFFDDELQLTQACPG